MNRFLTATVTDMRQGRETWRVFAIFCAPSFLLAIGAAVVERLV